MPHQPPLKALIFDLDGTLLNTLEDLRDSCNLVLAGHGLASKSLEETKYLVGEGMRKLMGRAAGLDPDGPAGAPGSETAGKIEALAAQMAEVYEQRWKLKTVPYPGIVELLGELNRRGTPLAVLSNKPQLFTEKTISHYFPQFVFFRVEGMREGRPAKPDPQAALAIAAEMGLAPAEIGFVGDSRTDMGTAVRAGMLPIGVLWGFRPERELLEHGARVIVRRPAEILQVLE